MIALVMAGAVLVATLAGIAAAAGERTLRLWGRQARWAWVAALAASLALPAAAALLPRPVPRVAGDARLVSGVRTLPPVVVRAESTVLGALVGAARRVAASVARLDGELAMAWGVLSLIAIARLAYGAAALRRARRGWRAEVVDTTPVLVARDAGPLVYGARQPRVVLPEWALALEGARRAMILRHEVEHARQRDPALLAAGALAVALMPWNPAAWWQLRRLRLAVELDCDARVLRAHPDVARYGLLLLDVARRAAPAWSGPALAAALVEPTTDLERRIATMRTKSPRHRVLRSAALALVGAAATFGAIAACRVSEAVPTGTASMRTPARATDTVTVARTQPVVATAAPASADGAAPAQPVREARTQRTSTPPDRAAATIAGKIARDSAGTKGDGQYFEFKITRAATPAPGNPGPVYPPSLRDARVEGEVVAQIVVDTSGRMMPGSFKVLRSTDTLFTKAVRDALDEMRFVPAEVGGRKVRQLLELPFQFQLTR
jgi:TonB family protein